MGQYESNNTPKTFRELLGMPERMPETYYKLGDCFFFDPYIQAEILRKAQQERLAARDHQEALALRTAMHEVELETWPETLNEPVVIQELSQQYPDVA